MKKTTTMTFAYGRWTCDSCKAVHDGYPIMCYCGRENTTSAKGNEKMSLPEIQISLPPKPQKNRKKRKKRIVQLRSYTEKAYEKIEIESFIKGESTFARLNRRRKELGHNY